MGKRAAQLSAARPAQAAREMLGQALGRIQDIRNPRLNVDGVTASIAN